MQANRAPPQMRPEEPGDARLTAPGAAGTVAAALAPDFCQFGSLLMLRFPILAGFALWMLPAAGAAAGGDPLATPVWDDVRDEFFASDALVFDDTVGVSIPADVENGFDVPLGVHLSPMLGDVREVVVIAENNPIRHVARLIPHRRVESVGLKIRLETSTAVRAAALTADGIWHVGSAWVNVLTPGGCSAPLPLDMAGPERRVGEIAVRTFGREDGASRLKFRIMHPMDTGFATTAAGDTIPAYYVETIEVADESGVVLEMITHAAMAPDPIFTVDIPELRQSLRIGARDSEGFEFEAYR